MKRWVLILGAAAVLTFAAGTARAQRPANVRSSEIVRVDGADYYLHTVRKGETLSSLSRLYGVPILRIVEDNPSLGEGLKVGQTIKIVCEDVPRIDLSSRRMARRFEEYIVGPGETTYSIARKYSLSINVLVEDNPGLDPSMLSVGQSLRIRRSEIGEASPQEILAGIDDYAAALSAVSDGYIYYVADIGETVYSISRKFGVSEADITDNNDLAGGLRAGAIVKIPGNLANIAIAPKDRSGGADLTPRGFPGDTPSRRDDDTFPGRPHVIPSYSGWEPFDLALLLPLSTNIGSAGSASAGKNNFVEFYQGALLALEDLKNEGYSLNVDLYDTQRSTERTDEIVASYDFQDTDLIIGPVYEEGLQPVMEFARERRVPVVSPLASVGQAYGELLYQLTPSMTNRYDKLREMFTPDKNIVFITTAYNDSRFEREMQEIAGGIPYQRVVYDKSMPADYVDELLVSAGRENLFVVLSNDEMEVDLVLAAISSVQNNRLARSIRTGPIKVIGHSRWLRYANLDRNLHFKLNVSFVVNYHADRSNAAVAELDRRYIVAFGSLPSLYSYRGYDAVKLFVGAMLSGGGDLNERLAREGRPLQSGYDFRYTPGGNNVNTEWSLVTYRNDYTISVR